MKLDIAKLLLRLTVGVFMLVNHGFPKLSKIIMGNFEFGNPIGIGEAPSLFLAVFAEFFCSILIVIGFKTKWATVPLAFTMFVAVFIVHLTDPLAKKELGFIYLVSYIIIYLIGPGKYSIDKK